jgi:DNA-binding transcriptional ArsR family regulator
MSDDVGINETLKALADPTRRRILHLLADGDRTAGEIAERFDLAKSTLSGHFNVLKSTGLIVSERSRNTLVYSINMSAFDDAADAVISFFARRRGHDDGVAAETEEQHE